MHEVIDEILRLEHFQMLECANCKTAFRYHSLQIHAVCPNCSTEQKVRAFFSVGGEIQDVIDAVLEWAGEGKSFEAVIKRCAQILEHHALLQQDETSHPHH